MLFICKILCFQFYAEKHFAQENCLEGGVGGGGVTGAPLPDPPDPPFTTALHKQHYERS